MSSPLPTILITLIYLLSKCCTRQNIAELFSTVQFSAVQYNSLQYNAVQYNTVLYGVVHDNTVKYKAVQSNALQYFCNQGCVAYSYLLLNINKNISTTLKL